MIKFEEFYTQFLTADTKQQKEDLSAIAVNQNYSFINLWILQLEKELKAMDESDFDQMKSLLLKAEEILPEPEKKSPLWEGIWRSLQTIFAIKRDLFNKIPKEERIYEWQVIFWNPFTNDGISTHAHLSFPEAAFLYSKYRKDLTKKEQLSLQRVQTFLAENGEQGPSQASLIDL
ncbi:MAG TPA: hypothetical protein VJ824_09840 [Bacillota bacterium]|nr:hypothetical protein [Bacillota bacterium]